MNPRTGEDRRRFYDGIADRLDELTDPDDLARRLEVIFDELLATDLANRRLLDAGCGTGPFSLRAKERGARVIALDIGPRLLLRARRRADGRLPTVVADALELPFRNGSFDVVLSSELIEHTGDPRRAVAEMARLLRPGGRLALTCPNRAWRWLVRLATALGLRPFLGLEDFPRFGELARWVSGEGLAVEAHFGFHPWPFQLRFARRLARRIDRSRGGTFWGRWMINQAILARRRTATGKRLPPTGP